MPDVFDKEMRSSPNCRVHTRTSTNANIEALLEGETFFDGGNVTTHGVEKPSKPSLILSL